MARIKPLVLVLAALSMTGCRADGTGPQRVTHLAGRVVFRNVDANGAADLFHVAIEGGDPVRLTSGGKGNGCPSISPDGATIVFSAGRVMAVDADGSNLRDLTPADSDPLAGFSCASWSPDGRKFSVVRRLHRIKSSGSSAVFVMTPDGVNVDRVASGDTFYQVNWSPVGDRILFSSSSYTDGGPYDFAFNVINSDGSQPGRTEQRWSGADWSPDASRVAFICGDGVENRLCVSRPDGSDVTALTPGGMLARNPDWAPIGNTIAFTCTQGLCTINADGTGFRMVAANGGAYAWSPDATQLVYSCGDALCLVNRDGSGSRTLVTLAGTNGSPVFSPAQ